MFSLLVNPVCGCIPCTIWYGSHCCCNAMYMYAHVYTCVHALYVYTCEVTCIVCGQVPAYKVDYFGDVFSKRPLSFLPPSSLLFTFTQHAYCCTHAWKWLHDMYVCNSFTPHQTNITPLYVASQNGHHDVVQTLVGAGADVNIARSDVSDMVLCSYTSIYACTH